MTGDARARAAYLAYRAGAELARVVPSPIGRVLTGGASRVMAAAWRGRRAQVARHLVRVTDGALVGEELDRAVREVFANYGRYWHELFRLPDASAAWIQAHFEIEGFDRIEAALAGGRGAILALPHLGHWDFAGAYLTTRGVGVTAVAEPVEPPELFEWFVALRRRLGIDVVPLGPDAALRLAGALAGGHLVCLLADRDLTGTGVEVEFFGERTTLPAGPAMLALRTGAPLLPAAVYFTGQGGHVGRVLPAVATDRRGRFRDDVVRITASLARCMEACIRMAPEQWLVMQPVWPSDRGDAGRSG